MKKYYHGSKNGNLTELTTENSEDGNVYVTDNRLVALTYAVRGKPNLFLTNHKGEEVFLQFYLDLFDEMVKGKSAYIYTIEDVGFESVDQSRKCGHKHCFKANQTAKVVKKEFIEDAYTELMKYVEIGELKIVTPDKMDKEWRKKCLSDFQELALKQSEEDLKSEDNYFSFFL